MRGIRTFIAAFVARTQRAPTPQSRCCILSPCRVSGGVFFSVLCRADLQVGTVLGVSALPRQGQKILAQGVSPGGEALTHDLRRGLNSAAPTELAGARFAASAHIWRDREFGKASVCDGKRANR